MRLSFSEKAKDVLPVLAVSFDLSGFSKFCSDPDAHAHVAKLISRMFGELNSFFTQPTLLKPDHLTVRSPNFIKYSGDGALMLWFLPENRKKGEEACTDVVNAMWLFQQRLNNRLIEWSKEWRVRSLPKSSRFGVATGPVFELRPEGQIDGEVHPLDLDYAGYCINLCIRLQDNPLKIPFLIQKQVSPEIPGLISTTVSGMKGVLEEDVLLFPEDKKFIALIETSTKETFPIPEGTVYKKQVLSALQGFLERWKTEIQTSPINAIYLPYNARRAEFAEHAARVEFEIKPSLRLEFQQIRNALKSFTKSDLHGDWAGNTHPVGPRPNFAETRDRVLALIESAQQILIGEISSFEVGISKTNEAAIDPSSASVLPNSCGVSLTPEEVEILASIPDNGWINATPTDAYGRIVSTGQKQFFRQDDPSYQARFLDAFDSLVGRGFLRGEGDGVHRLSGGGFEMRAILRASGAHDSPSSSFQK
jgi:hypothetical protein